MKPKPGAAHPMPNRDDAALVVVVDDERSRRSRRPQPSPMRRAYVREM